MNVFLPSKPLNTFNFAAQLPPRYDFQVTHKQTFSILSIQMRSYFKVLLNFAGIIQSGNFSKNINIIIEY